MRVPLANKPNITQTDVTNKTVTRYFVKTTSSQRITEVDLAQYTALTPLPYYQTISLPWTIGGNDKDITTKGNHIMRGAESKNIAVVEYYAGQMEGLRRVLRNPLEYFSGTVVTEESVWSPPPSPIVTTTSTTSTTTAAPTTTTTTTTTTLPFIEIEADYWWRADYGLTPSNWTAYNGDIDFTLNVTSVNNSTGIYFDGIDDYGVTPNLSQKIDAKHIFIRFEYLDLNTSPVLLGGTQNSIHEAFFRSAGSGYYWYFLNYGASTLYYATRGTTNYIPNNVLWADFEHNPSSVIVYPDQEETGYPHSVYEGLGTFNNKFTWEAGYGIYLGRRVFDQYANTYIKEVAIFTSSLSIEAAKEFRSQMMYRWPIPPATTTTTSTTTSTTTTTTTIGPTTTTTTTTLAQVYDIVGPEMTLTRANNQALYNSSLESGWDAIGFTSPSGSVWSSEYVSAYPLVFDEVDTGLILTRQNNMIGGGLFNTASESSWDAIGYTSPSGSEWNSIYTDGVNYGWTDLSNVTSRTYDTYRNALNLQIGLEAVSTELVMHDTINDKYYKFDITQWGQGGVGTYAYNRQLINTSSGALIGSPVFVTQSFWNDFSDVTTRTYDTFYNSLVQNVGVNIVPTELIMHDTINDEYYKFDITAWGSASQGATYAYNRQSIDTGSGVLSGSVVYISRP